MSCFGSSNYVNYETKVQVNKLLRHKLRGIYILSCNVLLHLLKSLRNGDESKPDILSLFPTSLNKYNDTTARMLDSNYHMI